jgi:hypothetical protein
MAPLHSVTIAAFLAVLALHCDGAAAESMPCQSFLPSHKPVGGSKTHTFLDGRQMNGETFNVGGYGYASGYPTGREFPGNCTFVSYDSPILESARVVEASGNKGIYSSYQGMFRLLHYSPDLYRITYLQSWTSAGAFACTKFLSSSDGPLKLSDTRGPELSVDDIDALPTTRMYQGRIDAWRESGLAFGATDGKVVFPELAFSYVGGWMKARGTLVDFVGFALQKGAEATAPF